ncbi:MAG TPA: hypothetical protein VG870_15475 [Chitinophagaceae bacterium]|nr:hypothetical protein [Chitinophagaceae bacterium]
MKPRRFLQAATLGSLLLLAAGCAAPRYYDYDDYPVRPAGPRLTLIISPFAGMHTDRYYDGRYYYRDRDGRTYWRGDDNRYYLDRSYVGRGGYDREEYREWKQHDHDRGHDRDRNDGWRR